MVKILIIKKSCTSYLKPPKEKQKKYKSQARVVTKSLVSSTLGLRRWVGRTMPFSLLGNGQFGLIAQSVEVFELH